MGLVQGEVDLQVLIKSAFVFYIPDPGVKANASYRSFPQMFRDLNGKFSAVILHGHLELSGEVPYYFINW